MRLEIRRLEGELLHIELGSLPGGLVGLGLRVARLPHALAQLCRELSWRRRVNLWWIAAIHASACTCWTS